jgi:hypothetical protein
MKLSRKDFTHARDVQLHAVGIVRANNPGWLKKALQREFTEEQVNAFRGAKKPEDTPPRPKDGNVEAVRKKLETRERIGFKKYGVTTERGDVDLIGWLNHLQQELMDATVYIEAAIQKLRVSGSSSTNEAAKSDNPEAFANKLYKDSSRDLA